MSDNKQDIKKEENQSDDLGEVIEEIEQELSEIDKLKLENDELNDKLIRHYAEFDNYKKRTTKEKEDNLIFAKVICLKDILSAVDNFERALTTKTEDENYKKGIEMIFNQLLQTIRDLGVEEINPLNEAFNPEYHSAVTQIENEELDSGVVAQVLQKGYKIQNRVIRHAMVVVTI